MIYGDGAIRRPGLYGSSIENTYAGVLSFMRRTYSREAERRGRGGVWRAAGFIHHLPLGRAAGPQAIRAASVQLAELEALPVGFDPFDDRR